MIRKIILPTILMILAYGFWISPNFKEISAGVAIFLFGMLFLEEGFKTFTGGLLERLLRKTTDSTWKSLSFGVLSTTIMQSSSLVSVITISFLGAGLIGLAAGIGIIFGANLGTTTGAWLIAGFGLKVKISAYAMPMLVFGIVLVFQKSKHLKGFGYILAGLGFLFLGIHHMKEGFEAFRDTIDLTAFAVAGYPGIFLFALIGIFATVVMQSSHATLVIIITALAAQQITYENALALAIGANIGTTITAILGAMSSNIQGRRLAGAHLIFNMVTGLIAIVFIYQIAGMVDWVSQGVGIADDNYTLKLAVFHSIFNLIGIVVMLPLIGTLVNFLMRTMPDKKVSVATPIYLSDSSSELPDTAIEAVRKETLHLYDNAFSIIAHGLSLHQHDILANQPLEEVALASNSVMEINIDAAYESNVKGLYSDIVGFISRTQAGMDQEQGEEMFALRAAGRDIVEAIKDTKHMQKNMSQYIISDNSDIRIEYNKIRAYLGSVLRRLEKVRQEGGDPTSILSLDAMKLEMKENDSTVNGMLETLIRENKITPLMATSLMNDASYAYHVTNNLVQMGEVLFATGSQSMKDAERLIALDDDDVTEALAFNNNQSE
ncbi:MAG: Na/Pi cotransporter family protein [Gammaproteobacteria bacterium]|jgi:phosphate:Na+ symporter|nr:Na/Pi cotransporter family protein [Gammaproteobacteria bacterium]MBT4607143.1 Na/Pi cotransporter family protein [Thiotrichales bacterium]MBT3471319.1 Na/Pi cotransporter family protein [Gammaproteobacteria bacterium]MBT3967841.1 Na/Pi cotransporter family protein [Gammaproteobacteria bacterium]MBT4081868.1 Na/Pi cotransporter family protein [Gammaproteobacteria bacterium]